MKKLFFACFTARHVVSALAFLLVTVGAQVAPSSARADGLSDAISVRDRARAGVMDRQIEGAYWNMPLYLGPHYVSQYYLMLRWLGRGSTRMDLVHFQALLAKLQRPDGSWEAIHDESAPRGDLNATILNYWALKAMGLPTGSPELARARAFVRSHGGIEGSSLFTKLFLILFRNYAWSEIPAIPYILFEEISPLNYKDFGQWIGPHLMPITYLKMMKVSREMGPSFALDELWADPAAAARFRSEHPAGSWKTGMPRLAERKFIDKMLSMQRAHGSWGGYTVSTLLTIAALDHLQWFHPAKRSRFAQPIERGYRFLEQMYFDAAESSYLGMTCDGRYWDTALMGIAAAESGIPRDRLRATARYLVAQQGRDGSFAFGLDFESYPDTDDTAEILMFLRKAGGFGPQIKRGAEWLARMQNSDGGWGAFDRNNTGNPLLRAFAKRFEDSADLFDESSADVTAHILEAFADLGYRRSTLPAMDKAIAYLKRTQEGFGGWLGRWGVNYLYGTGAAVTALVRAGEDPRQPYLRKAIAWLLSRQNADGGFGETFRSYKEPRLRGWGPSTPSQTAWVLLALLEAGHGKSKAADAAVAYLVREFDRDGKWIDRSTVGTGHPGTVAMDYPSYPHAFPLVAVSRYLKVHGK